MTSFVNDIFSNADSQYLRNYASVCKRSSIIDSAANYNWTFIMNNALTDLASIKINSDGWIAWFQQELLNEQQTLYRNWSTFLMTDTIIDPIVYVFLPDNSTKIWDGFHRIGAAFLNQRTIPSVIGYHI